MYLSVEKKNSPQNPHPVRDASLTGCKKETSQHFLPRDVFLTEYNLKNQTITNYIKKSFNKLKINKMKKQINYLAAFCLLLFCFLPIATQAQTTRYVKPAATGTGDGSSWANASGSIQNTINASASGDQVWIAAGTYLFWATLTMKDGVQVYGGFAGMETDTAQRQRSDLDGNGTIEAWEFTNATILDGQNVTQVLNQAADFIVETVWDGLTITGGRKTYLCKGGGAFIQVNGKLVNCIINGNSLYDSSSINSVSASGGGIYNDGGAITHCLISGNSAIATSSYYSAFSAGGGVYNNQGIISNCTVSGNLAGGGSYGGGIFNASGTINNCKISENSAGGRGGGIYNSGGIINNCTVSGNVAFGGTSYGGGVYNSLGIINNCTVSGNSAGGTNANTISYGGGIYNAVGRINNCTVSGNSVSGSHTYAHSYSSGGGIYCTDITNSIVSDCTVETNNVIQNGVIGSDGGGIYRGTVSRCIVQWNNAGRGGGLYESNAKNCLIVNNTGGGAYNGTYTNCTFVENTTGLTGTGGAINCIFWKNTEAQTTTGNVTYSAIQGGYPGTGNITLSNDNENGGAMFVNPAVGNFQLQAGSPCINAGSNSALSTTDSLDLAGNPRIYDNIVDMGAYEWQGTQDYTISGQVSYNGNPLAGVTINYTGGTVVTNSSGTYSITVNQNATVTLTPSLAGYTFTPASITCSNVTSNLYNQNFTAIQGANNHTITALSEENGTITPSGNISVAHSANQTFNFTPNSGYHIENVFIDGVNNPEAVANGFYTFVNVTTNHIIHVAFVSDSTTNHIITALTGGNGTITPSGNVSVAHGANQTFNFTPNSGYHIENVFIDGVNNPEAVTNGYYTFVNVTDNHSIFVVFFESVISEYLLFDTYAVTKWNNTFLLNLKKLAEEGYEVTACKWYKDGVKIGEGFSYSAGNSISDLLESGAIYTFELSTSSHGTLFSTDKVFNKQHSTLRVYPNPAPQGNRLTVEGTMQGCLVEVYSLTGACVSVTVATGNTTELTLDVPAGIYVVRSNNEEVKVIIK